MARKEKKQKKVKRKLTRPPRLFFDEKRQEYYIMKGKKKVYIKASGMNQQQIVQIVLDNFRTRRKGKKTKAKQPQGLKLLEATGSIGPKVIKLDDGLGDAMRFSKLFSDAWNREYNAKTKGLPAPQPERNEEPPNVNNVDPTRPRFDTIQDKDLPDVANFYVDAINRIISQPGYENNPKLVEALHHAEGFLKHHEMQLERIQDQDKQIDTQIEKRKDLDEIRSFKQIMEKDENRASLERFSKSHGIEEDYIERKSSKQILKKLIKKNVLTDDLMSYMYRNYENIPNALENLYETVVKESNKDTNTFADYSDLDDNENSPYQSNAVSPETSDLSKRVDRLLKDKTPPTVRQAQRYPRIQFDNTPQQESTAFLNKLVDDEGESGPLAEPRESTQFAGISDTPKAPMNQKIKQEVVEQISKPNVGFLTALQKASQFLIDSNKAQKENLSQMKNTISGSSSTTTQKHEPHLVTKQEAIAEEEGSSQKHEPHLVTKEEAIAEEEGNSQSAKGNSGNKSGLYDYELQRMMSKYPQFAGVYSIDELHKVPAKQKMGMILNLDPSNKPGSHWVALYIDAKDGESVEWYDSFGDEPPERVTRDLKELIERINPKSYLKFKINRVKQQRENSDSCGFHAMKFLIDRFKGKQFAECTGFSDVNKSEKKIKQFKKQLGFGFI